MRLTTSIDQIQLNLERHFKPSDFSSQYTKTYWRENSEASQWAFGDLFLYPRENRILINSTAPHNSRLTIILP